MEIRARYLDKEISEDEYYKICDEAGLEITAWIDEDFAREHGFTGNSIDLTSFASDKEWEENIIR
ncbi:hypothetical protein D0T57_14890 [Dysgonomonas sp. 511]|nr:hypothetical protein [Dysgonomonas sp. 511]